MNTILSGHGRIFEVERGHKKCARAEEYTDKMGTRPNPTTHARRNSFRLFVKPLLILFLLLSNLLVVNLFPRTLVFFSHPIFNFKISDPIVIYTSDMIRAI